MGFGLVGRVNAIPEFVEPPDDPMTLLLQFRSLFALDSFVRNKSIRLRACGFFACAGANSVRAQALANTHAYIYLHTYIRAIKH